MTTLVRSIYTQPDRDSTYTQFRYVVDQLEGRFPQAAELLADAQEELLAFTAFPKGRECSGRSGRTIRSSGSTGRCDAAPTSSAFSRIDQP